MGVTPKVGAVGTGVGVDWGVAVGYGVFVGQGVAVGTGVRTGVEVVNVSATFASTVASIAVSASRVLRILASTVAGTSGVGGDAVCVSAGDGASLVQATAVRPKITRTIRIIILIFSPECCENFQSFLSTGVAATGAEPEYPVASVVQSHSCARRVTPPLTSLIVQRKHIFCAKSGAEDEHVSIVKVMELDPGLLLWLLGRSGLAISIPAPAGDGAVAPYPAGCGNTRR